MEITCWGARGSIPVSGREYLRYGGDTTCLEVRGADGAVVVIDAGTGARRLGERLVRDGCLDISILFTHAHWDHLLGLPFFAPLYAPGAAIDLYGAPMAQTSVREIVSQAMRPPYFPVQLEDVAAGLSFHGACAETFAIGGITITPVPLSHPNGGLGYKLQEGGATFVFLTDNELGHRHEGGLGFEGYAAFCRGADLLVHDAEYTAEEAIAKRTWGHTSVDDAVRLALAAGVPSLGLFHHNQNRTDDGVDELVAESQARAERSGSGLRCFAAAQGMGLPVEPQGATSR
jgi:phosphoribosyl 1,2-cyclic phosphodiesterase